MKKKGCLFGFRSGTPWKKTVSVIYYAGVAVIMLLGLFSPPIVKGTSADNVIYRITILILFVWFESPAIFLSNTGLRRKLPFLRNGDTFGTIAGMMIVTVIFIWLFATVENMHSPEYKAAFETFMNSGSTGTT